MKAVRYHGYGDSSVLVLEEVERPVPGQGQVLVRVAATSFNPADAAIRAGLVQEVFPLTLPHVPGLDVAGTVAELGPDVTDWSVGDSVIGYLPVLADGAAAEFVLAPADLITRAPGSVELVEAAALPAAGLSAWQAVFDHAHVAAGKQVLVNGAGGAVGGYAVQLATNAGARVTATASPRSAERVRSYGPQSLIDHTQNAVTDTAERFDVVVNLVPTTEEESAALTSLIVDGGIVVSATSQVPGDPDRGVRAVRMASRSDAEQLAQLVAQVDAGELRIVLAARRPLSELAAVHAEADEGRLAGKTVVYPA